MIQTKTFVVKFKSGEVRECRLEKSVLVHVLNSGYQIPPTHDSIESVQVITRQDQQIVDASPISLQELANLGRKQSFEELRKHVHMLDSLLADPEPGLSSWCAMYSEHMKAICDYWECN